MVERGKRREKEGREKGRGSENGERGMRRETEERRSNIRLRRV